MTDRTHITAEKAPPPRKVRFPIFLVVSGIGWLMDITLMTALVASGVAVVTANMISAAIAVSFVFLVSQKKIFFKTGTSLKLEFGLYLIWHAVFITLASLAVGVLSTFIQGCGPFAEVAPAAICTRLQAEPTAAAVAKILVTPVTVYLNFVFMSWLIEKKVSWV